MYIIVVGLHAVGERFVGLARSKKHDVVGIDKDSEQCKKIAGKFDALTISGDATSRQILEEAGISRADALVATTDKDSVNLLVSLMAKEAGVKIVVSTVNHHEHETMFKNENIITIMNPYLDIANHLYWAIERPNVREIVKLEKSDAEMFELDVGENSNAIGIPISELKLADGVLVVCIEREGKTIIPKGDTKILSGDKVTIFTQSEKINKIINLFTGK